MGTWVAAILETGGRADFWDVARRHGVQTSRADVPGHALVDCGAHFEAGFRIAEALSSALGTRALGFCGQSAADAYGLRQFEQGRCVRKLEYSRDYGGWLAVEGAPQPWEPAFFFGGATATSPDAWPEMLSDEASDDEVARFEDARRRGDPTPVIPLLHPGSLMPLHRVARSLGVSPDAPDGTFRPPSLWSRLLRGG